MGFYTDDPLWQALADMRIEPAGADLTFIKRLARENGWSAHHAGAVMEEYRRFLYLAATDNAAVTPSHQVDQAWHLHLAYTRHYWGALCANIIGRPLHHGPTAGGGAERRRYRVQYADTLQRYRQAFGTEPPISIWPPPAQRFSTQYQWVDRSSCLLLPKSAIAITGMATGAVLLAACTALAASTGAAAQGTSALERFFSFTFGSTAGLIVTMLAALVAMIVIGTAIDRLRGRATPPGKARRRRDGGDSSGDSSDTSERAHDGAPGAGSGAAAGGSAFMGSGGDFGGAGSDSGWDSASGISSDSSSGCGGGCGGGD